MPITLITGLPRNGKSLWMIGKYKDAHNTRPVYYANIPGLKLPWKEWDPQKWQDLPDGSLFVIDECQEFFPLRGREKPPEWIEQLARHGHRGLDFVLITQGPMLIDSFVRNLVQTHYDVVRAFGAPACTVHEWPTGVYDQCRKNSKGSTTHLWKYDKSLYDLYTSSAQHTVKVNIPAKLILLGIIPVLVAGVLYWLTHRHSDNPVAPGPDTAASAAPGAVVAPGSPDVLVEPGKPRSEYRHVDFRPRVPGLPHTAPAYDHLTAPVEAPYPAYCISLGTEYDCKCYTQRNTALHVPRPLCETIARDGFFAYWREAGPRSLGGPQSQALAPAFGPESSARPASAVLAGALQ